MGLFARSYEDEVMAFVLFVGSMAESGRQTHAPSTIKEFLRVVVAVWLKLTHFRNEPIRNG